MAWLTINFRSKALRMPVMMDALIPQGHGSYRTLYLLHGAGGDHTSWVCKSRIADYVEGKNIAVIMPSGNNRCYVNNRHGKNYFDFISSELPEQCETWFSLSQDAQDRYIAGMSMGGYGAFYAALNKPGQYAAAFSYSGLLDMQARYDKPQGIDLFPVFGSREEFIHNGYDLLNKIGDNPTSFYISCGLSDPRVEMSRRCYEKMRENGYRVFYSEQDGGHDWAYWDRCIEKTVRQIAEGAPAPDWRNTCQSSM